MAIEIACTDLFGDMCICGSMISAGVEQARGCDSVNAVHTAMLDYFFWRSFARSARSMPTSTFAAFQN